MAPDPTGTGRRAGAVNGFYNQSLKKKKLFFLDSQNGHLTSGYDRHGLYPYGYLGSIPVMTAQMLGGSM